VLRGLYSHQRYALARGYGLPKRIADKTNHYIYRDLTKDIESRCPVAPDCTGQRFMFTKEGRKSEIFSLLGQNGAGLFSA